jgi:predicted RNase H-like nuclease (RuvC/YqgF family)
MTTVNNSVFFCCSEQDSKLDALYKENVALQREATVLRNQNAKLDASYHEKEKSLNCLKTRFAVLEQVGNIFCTK